MARYVECFRFKKARGHARDGVCALELPTTSSTDPFQPPFRTPTSQGGSSPSQRADGGVRAITAIESFASIVPAAAAAPALQYQNLGPRRGAVVIRNRFVGFRVGILAGDSNLTE